MRADGNKPSASCGASSRTSTNASGFIDDLLNSGDLAENAIQAHLRCVRFSCVCVHSIWDTRLKRMYTNQLIGKRDSICGKHSQMRFNLLLLGDGEFYLEVCECFFLLFALLCICFYKYKMLGGGFVD